MTTFRHRPLTTETCIRLVILHPGLEADTIQCSLSEIDLKQDGEAADLPEFEALSYTWGLKVAEEIILVEGAEVLIRHNLFLFLQQLRNHDLDRKVVGRRAQYQPLSFRSTYVFPADVDCTGNCGCKLHRCALRSRLDELGESYRITSRHPHRCT